MSELMEKVVRAAQGCADLPEETVAEILQVMAEPERLAGRETELALLLEQIDRYDPYAGVGCFGDACSLEMIRRTLHSLGS